MPFSQIRDCVHHYRVDGAKEKPAQIFANSLGSDRRIWDGVATRLLPPLNVIGYELRG